MPNWCSNNVTFSHGSERELDRLVKAYNENRLMSEFFPCPEELQITAGKVGADDSPEQMDLVAKEQANIEKHGFANWYDWCVANWGTKWDVESVDEVERNDGQMDVSLYFDSAWAPPVGFYQHMEELGWTVKAYYYEPGMAFCGVYEDGADDCIEITGDSKWVVENVPAEIDDMFNISASMEEWEDELAEEEKDSNNAE